MDRDYQQLEEQDQYEAEGLDDEVDDKRDFATIMADRRAADEIMDDRDEVPDGYRGRKLPTMLHEHGKQSATSCDSLAHFPYILLSPIEQHLVLLLENILR